MAVERINDKRARLRVTLSGPLWARVKRLCELVDDTPDRAMLVAAHIGAQVLAEQWHQNELEARRTYARLRLDVGPVPLADNRFRAGSKTVARG